MTNYTEKEIKNQNGDCTKYTGTVTVSSYLGDRLIQKETNHNAGLINLFKFISSCIQGNWQEAKYKRPCKLVLLKQADGESFEGDSKSTPLNKNANEAFDTEGNHFWSSKYAISSPIMYDNAVVDRYDTVGSNPQSSVTFQFRIPFLSLVNGSDIKKLMLLPSTTSDYIIDACAYYVLENSITVPSNAKNFTVIIDWTLTFNNNND